MAKKKPASKPEPKPEPVDEGGAVEETPAVESPVAEAPLPEHYEVDLPQCLLGRIIVEVTSGDSIEARKETAFERYKLHGGVNWSRFLPTITPVADPSRIKDTAVRLLENPPEESKA